MTFVIRKSMTFVIFNKFHDSFQAWKTKTIFHDFSRPWEPCLIHFPGIPGFTYLISLKRFCVAGGLACTTIGIALVISAVATASLVDSCAADTAFFRSDVFACFDTGNVGLQCVTHIGV